MGQRRAQRAPHHWNRPCYTVTSKRRVKALCFTLLSFLRRVGVMAFRGGKKSLEQKGIYVAQGLEKCVGT